jgi:hypothetical protein
VPELVVVWIKEHCGMKRSNGAIIASRWVVPVSIAAIFASNL